MSLISGTYMPRLYNDFLGIDYHGTLKMVFTYIGFNISLFNVICQNKGVHRCAASAEHILHYYRGKTDADIHQSARFTRVVVSNRYKEVACTLFNMSPESTDVYAIKSYVNILLKRLDTTRPSRIPLTQPKCGVPR
jgi:hypothetical protein